MVDGWETAYRRAVTKRQRLKDGHPLPPAAPDLRDDLALLRELPQPHSPNSRHLFLGIVVRAGAILGETCAHGSGHASDLHCLRDTDSQDDQL